MLESGQIATSRGNLHHAARFRGVADLITSAFVRRGSGVFVILLGAGLTLSAPFGCSSQSSQQTLEKTCVAGAEEACSCADSSRGVHACRSDGTGFEACNCGSGGAAGSAGSGSGGSSSAGDGGKASGGRGGDAGAAEGGDAGATGGEGGSGGPVADGTLGAPCTGDTDCMDLSCITNVQGPQGLYHLPGGSCSLDCMDALDCPAASVCIQISVAFSGYCAELCNYGPANATAFNPEKCHGRSDFACAPFPMANPQPTCLPSCNSDADCMGGNFCDLGNGVCVTTPPGSEPTGSVCTPGPQELCSGICNSLIVGGNPTGLCSDLCTLGADDACSAVSADDAACFGDTTNEGVGDQGQCVELCDCASDCRFQSLVCVELSDPVKGHAGYCGVLMPGNNATGC
jgi:hypothetical protein